MQALERLMATTMNELTAYQQLARLTDELQTGLTELGEDLFRRQGAARKWEVFGFVIQIDGN